MVRVGVVKVYDSDTQVLFLMSEIKFVRHVVGIFMGWLTHIVKPVFDEVFSLPSECINFSDIVNLN